MNAPVVMFAYKRPRHTMASLQALSRNPLASGTDLYVFCDGPRSQQEVADVAAVRALAREAAGFACVRVIEQDANLGLANSVIQGVSRVFESSDRVIVLEDDLVTSPNFLAYMNAALEHYARDPGVFSVTGHTFPARFLKIPSSYPYHTYSGYRCSSWSWGTWRDRWRLIDWAVGDYGAFAADAARQAAFERGGQDMSLLLRLQKQGRIDSWAIRFCYAHHVNDMRCIYPTRTLVRNIGLDNSGTHSAPDPKYSHPKLDQDWMPTRFCPANPPDPTISGRFRAVFDPGPASVPVRLARAAKRVKRALVPQAARTFASRVARFIRAPVQPVDVLLLNSDQDHGGAARAAYRIFCGIRRRYPSARFLTLFRGSQDPGVIGLLPSSLRGAFALKLMALDQRPLRAYPARSGAYFSPAWRANPLRTPLSRFRPGLVHAHWLGRSLLRVEELAAVGCPVVWTLHDCWAMTGGCHYAGECEGYRERCGRCPQLGSRHESDLSRALMDRKARAFENLDLTIVAPSRWLAGMARRSSLFSHRRIEIIPNGLDLSRYKPIDRKAAREYLDLPVGGSVLLFGGHWLEDPRKGADLLCKALETLSVPWTLLTFGQGRLPLTSPRAAQVLSLGTLADDSSLALAYSAADAFLCPSREDNLPNTVAEALACGTPCVAFDINGLPDMIEHQRTGWLARPFEVADFARGIEWVLSHPDPGSLRRQARQKALSEYDLTLAADRYAALYGELLAPRAKDPPQPARG